ncbi:unnamed protein product [Paramecium sonneborni]|uniref:14-3-3 domain-containing protein n=1 Tax=Paramecium sonneborni TaxID=65129 RepID=A0A8S1RMH0_9CILI|nr:unnamed protein product [Paramecium sonneborni]
MSTRVDLIYMIKLTQITERFEDMVNYIKQIVHNGQELSSEERNLFSVAYKNIISRRRTALSVLSSIERIEEAKVQSQYVSQNNLKLIRSYKKKIEEELNQYCFDILNQIDCHLIKTASTPESKVLLHKMKGDYHRYIWEYASVDQRKNDIDSALAAYSTASNVSNSELKTTNPIRLGLALNFSAFYYDVMNDAVQAYQLAQLLLMMLLPILNKLKMRKAEMQPPLCNQLEITQNYGPKNLMMKEVELKAFENIFKSFFYLFHKGQFIQLRAFYTKLQ